MNVFQKRLRNEMKTECTLTSPMNPVWLHWRKILVGKKTEDVRKQTSSFHFSLKARPRLWHSAARPGPRPHMRTHIDTNTAIPCIPQVTTFLHRQSLMTLKTQFYLQATVFHAFSKIHFSVCISKWIFLAHLLSRASRCRANHRKTNLTWTELWREFIKVLVYFPTG